VDHDRDAEGGVVLSLPDAIRDGAREGREATATGLPLDAMRLRRNGRPSGLEDAGYCSGPLQGEIFRVGACIFVLIGVMAKIVVSALPAGS
jgi:hypothetical protein